MNKPIPKFLYGTAWKEDETPRLTYQALHAGFMGIDTANQRKHYFEEGVGVGIKKFSESKNFDRSKLFLQTKFTFARGQDHRKPYNEADPFAKQVADSFASSLKHLGTDHIDSYVLHGPYFGRGISNEDLETWAAMESLVESKKVTYLGVSNISAEQLTELCKSVRIKPKFVQNRCYAALRWDREVREICKSEGLIYQGFSLLTANQRELASTVFAGLAHTHSKTIPQIVFRFCLDVGMLPLTGTNSPLHMKQDLDIEDFKLTEREISQIENVSL
jgi:diketogulonate reductase-like aldo/keto reductase